VTAEELVFSRKWTHALDRKGAGETEIRLQDGRTISSAGLKAVFNRIRFFPAGHFIDAADRSYAEMEIYALYISFLESVRHLLVEPLETRFMYPDQINNLFYYKMAVESELPVLDYHFSTSPRMHHTSRFLPVKPESWARPLPAHESSYLVWQNQPVLFLQPYAASITVQVVGRTIVSRRPLPFDNGIREFARRIGKRFFDIHFAETEEGYKMHSVEPFPDTASPKTIEALAGILLETSERER
jgi:hypothetical protein